MAPSGYKSLKGLTVSDRRAVLHDEEHPVISELAALDNIRLGEWARIFDGKVENVVGAAPMALSIVTGVKVNGLVRDVPLVNEEASVVAGLAKAVKLCGTNGFRAAVGGLHARAHAVFLGMPMSAEHAMSILDPLRREIWEELKKRDLPYASHGGAPVDLKFTPIRGEFGEGLEVEITAFVDEAMGANGVTRMAAIAGEIAGARLGLTPDAAICINDNPERSVDVTGFWHASSGITIEQIDKVIKMQQWAEAGPDRAKTHNKGIMNGIDAVCLATGQDFRAVEAGASADAYRSGTCKPLTSYRRLKAGLGGRLKVQLSIGTVGGATSFGLASWARRQMKAEDVRKLMAVIGAVGLAQNFAALLCLGSEGIPEAHRRIGHRRKPTHP